MKKLTIGLVAHVDAGKTTLAEALLYAAGKIRKPGRKGVWIMVAIGFAEFVAFMILMRVTKV